MAKTPSSTRSESVTLRIPNEVFSQVLNYAADSTKGNRSEAIVSLIEMGLAVALRQQPTQTGQAVQDTVMQIELLPSRQKNMYWQTLPISDRDRCLNPVIN